MELDKQLPTVIGYDNEILVSNASITSDGIYRIIDFDDGKEIIGKFLMEEEGVANDYVEYKENIIPGSSQEKWATAQKHITDKIDDMVDVEVMDIISKVNTLTDLKEIVDGREYNQSDGKAILIFTTPLSDKEYIAVSTSGDSDKGEGGANE